MARTRTSNRRNHSGTAAEAQETLGLGGGQEGHGRSLSKTEAGRLALREGIERPQEAVAFIEKRFGIQMTPMQFSQIKLRLKRREGEAEPSEQTVKGVEGYLAPPKIEATGEGDLIDVLEQMKPLIARYGAENVKRIVDLLG